MGNEGHGYRVTYKQPHLKIVKLPENAKMVVFGMKVTRHHKFLLLIWLRASLSKHQATKFQWMRFNKDTDGFATVP